MENETLHTATGNQTPLDNAVSSLNSILDVIFTVNDYVLFFIILIIIFAKSKSRLFKLAFGYSGISVVFLLSSYFLRDDLLFDINNTPRFGLLMINIGMITTALYLIYWLIYLFNESGMIDSKKSEP
ncbi:MULTISPECIES: hypothetical protein [Enterobacterales]|uniref:Uncharacterized protein n=5 Tax=Morganellaceae TaxID=1903414 RepID=A0AAI9MTD1_MORMO|nr:MULTISPECIES: hypothetical protein [Enterobacterales]EJD6040500.1 hypothetical protein [Morganella morganii]MEB1123072.1 hypothetical protein [Citrobacter freundii]EIL1984783.1 hypothetical protein [Providencia rettgeri]EJD6040823.1 hypothetical protein [Morganella morganii]EJD6083808.1 hypothetical protein [Providencia rettgeri]